MKKLMLFGMFFSIMGIAAYAQEKEAVTDEELAKFANMEVMTSNYQEEKTQELISMIVNNEKIDGGARYNEIKAAWGDEAKMVEAKVTEDEKIAYQAVKDFQDLLQEGVITYKTDLIKDDAILGVTIYNKVNGAIKEDPALKEKLDTMIEAQKAKEAAEKPAVKDGI